MNNPNPFVPKGSLLEQQNKRRTHMKLGVFCVLAVSVAGLMAMLIQGCKQKTPTDDGTPPADTNSVSGVSDTNNPPTDLSNSNQPPSSTGSTGAVMVPSPNTPTAAGGPGGQPTASPIMTPTPTVSQPPMTPVAPEAGGTEYVVVKGDILSKIAKKNGVTLKALLAANPDVKPTKLKVGQKLVIPAGGKSLTDANAGADTGAVADTGGTSYTVKSGDTLTKIAKAHHVKLKALQTANGLTTTKIKVGQKLKIPSKGEAPVAPVEAPVVTPTVDNSTMPAPPVPQVSNTPAAPAPPVQH